MQDLLDRALGKYVILEEIGRGGMGAVYKARDVELDRIVAMKVLSPYLVGEPRLVQRFMREARLAANLDHPNIVTIYDIGGEGGYYYFVMKYLEGRPLKQMVSERGALPLDEVVSIVRQLAAALDYAHQQNLIHRDVKPGNVIVTDDGQVTLTDFGLAKVAENLKLTASGETIGTLEYLAPEQARGEVDRRSDIYSLGVITYELLTGRLPFQGENQATVLYQHLHEPPPPMQQWNPHLTPEIEAVVLKAMAKDPAERYQTAGELAQDLEQAARKALVLGVARRPAAAKAPAVAAEKTDRAARSGPAAAPRPAPRTLIPPFWRRWWWAFLIGILLLAGGSGGGLMLYQASIPPTPVPIPAMVGPINPHYIPLIEKAPPVASEVAQGQLALLCELDTVSQTGRLATWKWGQALPSPWIAAPAALLASQLSWSPDGKTVALVAAERYHNLYRIHADGTGLKALTSTPAERTDPAWSPTLSNPRIAFAAGPVGERDIFLVPIEGGEALSAISEAGDDWAPAWFPDGRKIVFTSDRDGNPEIYRMDLDSKRVQRLTDDPGVDVYPAVSTDGQQIAFLSDRSGEFHLYLMSAGGTKVRLLFDGLVALDRPAWSPSGEWLAFTRQIGGIPQVFFLNVSSGQLYAGPAGCRHPAWRPQP